MLSHQVAPPAVLSPLQEPNSWNDRGFTVAQGDGLFKHTDRTKIWSV